MGGAATDGIKVGHPRTPLQTDSGARVTHAWRSFPAPCGAAAEQGFRPPRVPHQIREPQTRSRLPCFSPRRPHSLSWAPPRLPPPFLLRGPEAACDLSETVHSRECELWRWAERRHSCRLACPSGPPSPVSRWRHISPAPSPFDPLGLRGGMPPRPQGPSSQHCCRPCGKLDRLAFLL